jgi:hypothetical protein
MTYRNKVKLFVFPWKIMFGAVELVETWDECNTLP